MSALLSVDRELGRILTQAAIEEHSGVITGTRGKLKRLFCLVGGSLSCAISNVVEEQVEEYLIRSGVCPAPDLLDARRECAKEKIVGLTGFLLDSGRIPEERLRDAIENHIRELLFATLDWTDGQCAFERGQPDLSGHFTVRANITSLLMEYAQTRPESLNATMMRIGAPNTQPVTSLHSEKLLAGVRPDATAVFVLSASDGTRPLGGLIPDSPAAAETTWRSIYGLVLAGVIVPRGSRREDLSAAGTVSRDELLARLERAEGANHYGVLGLAPSAKNDEIREAYYFLARRYHPDRFRSSKLEDLIARIESYFAQVTEAHNTLSNTVKRADYDKELAEQAGTKKPEQDTRDLARQNYRLALTLIERRRYTDAVTSLENAIQLDGTQATYYLELGRLQSQNPRHRDLAEKNLIRANEIDPALYEGYYALGSLYARTQRKKEAARLFREVLRWEPGHVAATEQLAELGDLSDAEGGGRRGLFRG
jgi:curved DNA-binding protein CbpA